MKLPVEEVGSPDRQESAEPVPAPEVQKTLSAILQSAPFRTTKQIQKLLQFLVSETLAGRAETLKERIIGASLFDRRSDYDTNDDPIVRLRVAELRKRLALYYQTAGDEPVLISIPSGSFRAVFEWSRTGPAQSPPVSPRGQEPSQSQVPQKMQPASDETAESMPAPSILKSRALKLWIAFAACLVLLTFATAHHFASADDRALDRFWSPVLSHSGTTLIYIGNNPVYEMSPYFVNEYFEKNPNNPQEEETGSRTFIPAPPEITDATKEVSPAKDTYVSNGDVAATSKIVALMAKRSKQFDIRYGSDVTYGDIRQSPTILIGAHNNYWTLRTTKNLRVGFEGFDSIMDRSNPNKRWSATSDRSEDYALVSRELNSWNGKVVIVIAGVGQGGTRAAAEFITNPQSMEKLVKSLPKGWESKSIQVVLHTTVKNQIPSAPEVVAAYCW